jgi:hypothetical protein
MINRGVLLPKEPPNVGFTKEKCAIYNKIKIGFNATRSYVSALDRT